MQTIQIILLKEQLFLGRTLPRGALVEVEKKRGDQLVIRGAARRATYEDLRPPPQPEAAEPETPESGVPPPEIPEAALSAPDRPEPRPPERRNRR